MDKSQAKEIVKNTFENSFSEDNFRHFIRNLLNHIEEEDKHPSTGQFIPTAFQPFISSFKRIGKYHENGNEMDVLVVQLKKETTLERARTAQRNFIARYLNGSHAGKLKDAALVAFVSPNEADWRFSLIKMDYKFSENKDGKTKVKEEFTPARRWSFLVGPNEHSHTAQAKLVPLLEDEDTITLASLEESFNIEKVTKEFFEKYRDLFLRTKEALDELVKNDDKLRNDFEEKFVDTADFTKKLLGQIVFLYFLQKKGWFGVKQGMDWGSGSKCFMRDLFAGKNISYSNFFNDVLEPLFYDALARDRSDIDHFNHHLNCKIPFLNGGLFDPISGYSWEKTEINLPNELFSNSVKDLKTGDVGTGILDVFDRYNFTVKEDEPLEKEVAVDPEMLGKVFENLLEVKDRKSKGTYYTPREIVNYMCEQSLLNYLATELEGKVTKDEIEELIKTGENVIEHETVALAKEDLEKYKGSYKRSLADSIKQFAKEIDNKLATIKVCDPAIGSGAFPVGMMNAIVKTRLTLNPYLCGEIGESGGIFCPGRTPYEFKRDCIQNSIYGVDIDPGAVEIAKLRLWLSLVVDESDIKQIKPLPNLDYKIMQGNSLLEEYEGIKLFDEKLIVAVDTTKADQIGVLKRKQTVLQKQYIDLHSKNQLTPEKQVELSVEIKRLQTQSKKLSIAGKEVSENAGLFDINNEAKLKADKLKRLHKEFFEANNKSKKDNIKKEIEQLEWQLIEATLKEQNKIPALKKLEEFKRSNIKPFFLWKLNFSDVFEEKGGFDVVIGNPPYVQLQKDGGKLADIYKNSGYKVFERMGDIYALFYEKGINILKRAGYLCFITSNKWMRAEYGKSLRMLFCLYNPMLLVDLGPGIFETASVDTSIIIIGKDKNCGQLSGISVKSKEKNVSLSDFIDENKSILPKMGEGVWFIGSQTEQKLKDKIERIGKPLKESGVSINYGIKTGLNQAFIIDQVTHDRMVLEDQKCADILKPILRGRDIKRYKYEWAGLWIIFIPWHFPLNDDGAIEGASKKAEMEFKEQYPTIHKHLLQFKKDLLKRNIAETGIRYEWYALQRCAATYYHEFYKEKVVWQEMSQEPCFAYDNSGLFCNDTGRILTGNFIKYFVGLFNSHLFKYVFSHFYAGGGLGEKGIRFKSEFMNNFPTPDITSSNMHIVEQIENIVNKILVDTKSNNCLENPEKKCSVDQCEKQIDQLVYSLYGLTGDEIKIVEGTKNV